MSETITVESLSAQLAGITFPTPKPTTHPDLVDTNDLHREEDLLRNPSSFRTWWTAIQNTKEISSSLAKTEGPLDISPDVAALLGPLASPNARKSLQRLTYLYEAALAQFPGSFKLWKSYLLTRMSYVLGKPVHKKRGGGRKKFPEMKDALEDEREDQEKWEGGVDPVVGWEEWKSLVATFERALMWLPRVRFRLGLPCIESLIIFQIDASAVAALPVHLRPPVLSSPDLIHACSPNVRPCPSHPSSISTLTHMGSLPPLGRVKGWCHDGCCLPEIPLCRSKHHRTLCHPLATSGEPQPLSAGGS